MFEQVVYFGHENFYIEEFGVERNCFENKSDFNPFLNDSIVKDKNLFLNFVGKELKSLNKNKNLTILLPDIMFFSKVLYFEKFPISLKKKNELIFWKLENYLPAKQNLYDIQYSISNNFVLTFAIPKTNNNIINNCIMNNYSNEYNILPEFLYILNNAKKNNLINCILIINRKKYFTATYLKDGFPLFIRTRLKTDSIKMEDEINIFKNIINEKWDGNKEIVVFGEYLESYKCFQQEWL